MDPNQLNQPQVTIPTPTTPSTETQNNNNLKIIIAALALVVILLIPSSVYIYVNYFSGPNELVQQPKVPVPANDPELASVTNNSTEANVNQYLQTIDDKSASSSDKFTKDLYTLTKANLLSLNRGADKAKNAAEATDLFVELINANTATDAPSQFITSYSVTSLVRLHNECCSSVGTTSPLFSKSIAGFTSKYDEYIKAGYSIEMSKMLSLNDLLTIVPEGYKNDIYYRRDSMDIKSYLLSIYEKKMPKELRANIMAGLKDDLDGYGTYQALTVKEPIRTAVEAKSIHAYAFDIYHQKNGDAAKFADEINQNYEEVDALTPENIRMNIDVVGLKEIKYYNILRYISSLNSRFGTKVDKKLQASLVDQWFTLKDSSPEVQVIAKNYFTSPELKTGRFPSHTYFASLRTKYKSIDTYLKSIGV